MDALLHAAVWLAQIVPSMLLLLYSLNMYALIFMWVSRSRSARAERDRIQAVFRQQFTEDDLPAVVTQIPCYNEANVIERAMRAAARMRYPSARHTIQVLDDSTDDTRDVVDRVAAELTREGHRIQVLRRPHRTGYKAGALEYGMRQTKADFFAIFDADFVPPEDFLVRAVPVMVVRTDVGLVQARWGHLNADESLMTRIQAIAFDGHFVVDQGARAWNGLFMNFNGTAGMWRRQAVEQGGGWEHDTLTEDLDLSYRSQMAGWKCFYLPDLVVPAEIPNNINAFKTQQFRWAKGFIQTARKIIPQLLRCRASPLAKLQALLHITSHMVHPLMLWLLLMAIPLIRTSVGGAAPAASMYSLGVIFLVGMLAPYLMYGLSQIVLRRDGWKQLIYLPALTLFGIGLAVSNTRAVVEALLGRTSEFVRTPKAGDRPRAARRYAVGLSWVTVVELLIAVYSFVALFFFVNSDSPNSGYFLLISAAAFSMVSLMSIKHAIDEAAPPRALPAERAAETA